MSFSLGHYAGHCWCVRWTVNGTAESEMSQGGVDCVEERVENSFARSTRWIRVALSFSISSKDARTLWKTLYARAMDCEWHVGIGNELRWR
ncbi:hypothetical protein CEXT_322831 [Caerostris extrusa]|uniref:Uncharacterized protein n=1 Tax=Caerostris extrusa TaxID=172846 RepID=A0AAV4Y5E8_CAEEX|nr:hypothetical protein CEXT_322831 [Caerostris extrusa]